MRDWSKDPEVIELRDVMISVGRLAPDADMDAMEVATRKLLNDFLEFSFRIGHPPPPKPADLPVETYLITLTERIVEYWLRKVKASGRDPCRNETIQ